MKYNQPFDQPSSPNAAYVDGNPGAGIQGSIVPAAAIEFDQREIVRAISDVGLSVPSNSDLTQLSQAVRFMRPQYVIDSGVLNQLTVTLNPAPLAWATPLAFFVLIGHTTTTVTPTCTIAGLTGPTATKTIVKRDGTALAIGDLVQGVVALFVYDGTNVRVVSLLPSEEGTGGGGPGPGPGPSYGGTAGQVLNLRGRTPGLSMTATFTADEILVEQTLGGVIYKGANLALNFNGATVGLNGLDTGTMPINADLSVYAIFNPTTSAWACLGCAGSTSNGPCYTGAHMPAGYTASGLIFAGKTDSSGNFQPFQQTNRKIDTYCYSFLYTTNSPTVVTSLSVAALVPAIAKTIWGIGGESGGSTFTWLGGSPNGPGAPELFQAGVGNHFNMMGLQVAGSVNGSGDNWGPVEMGSPQTLYYVAATSAVASNWQMSGYSI